MKKFIAILVVLVASLLVVTGCGGEEKKLPPTEGLEYTLLDDDTYEVAIGEARECTNIVIPSDYDGKPVTKIAANGFWEANMISVLIPDTVTEIGILAFGGCTSLTNITIPNSVTEIDWYAFFGCTSLTNITIPDSVTEIEQNAFDGCTSLTAINVDKYSPYYSSDDGVLFNKTKTQIICVPEGKTITTYTIPNSVTEIEQGDFDGCKSLTQITIPKSVTKIDTVPFDGCTSLTAINVDKYSPYYSSDDGVLFDKTKTQLIRVPEGKTITTYTIPNSVTEIEQGAFSGCTSLTSITIPDSVTEIDWYAFDGCTNLTTINVDKYSPYYFSDDGVLFDKTKTQLIRVPEGKNITTYTIPNSVTEIDWCAFSGCTSLTSITIPDSVTEIGWYVFSGCTSLKNITIPDGVTEIDWRAFSGCTSLTSITIPDSVTEIGWYAFSGCTSLKTINFNGTVEEWNSIDKSEAWNDGVPATVVVCTDGEARI